MRQLSILIIALLANIIELGAQTKVTSPHPNIKIEVQEATLRKGAAFIDLLVTNTAEDMHIALNGGHAVSNPSIIYNDKGEEVDKFHSIVKVGVGEHRFKSQSIESELPRNIPIRIRIKVERIKAKKPDIKKLEIGISSSHIKLDRDKIIFEDIAFER